MKYVWWGLCLFFFPMLAVAADSSTTLSFTPPPTDSSVIFLADMFGVVDGVLHGTGSQIMGAMFLVFNSAVLAIGGIVIMYILIVGTMNTAQDGEFLGKKWSNIWIPVRSTTGLALLIPKASGYCLMQIFVMWVVVQGVGAGDKIWNAALDYLAKGGVIIKAQMASSTVLAAGGAKIATGGSTILGGLVCMAGLQKQLEAAHDYDASQQNTTNSGPCVTQPYTDQNAITAYATICNNPVPDLISSVNMVTAQTKEAIPYTSSTTFKAPMPNFDTNNPYNALNGICGTIKWKPYILSDASRNKEMTDSRAIAIQQLYSDLAMVAQVMVNNDPQLNPAITNTDPATNASAAAVNQFGVAYDANGSPCTNISETCVMWGITDSPSKAVLLNGTEFSGAIMDYNAIMQPAINQLNQDTSSKSYQKSHEFIQKAHEQGWMSAGSYFFDLARLNGNASQTKPDDSDSGLDTTMKPATLSDFFKSQGATPPCQASANTAYSSSNAQVCYMLNTNVTAAQHVNTLIDGTNLSGSTSTDPAVVTQTVGQHASVSGVAASTAYGYVTNSTMVQVPGQAGLDSPKFNFNVVFPAFKPVDMGRMNFACGGIMGICVGRMLGDLFMNDMILMFLSLLATMAFTIVQSVFMVLLVIPMSVVANTFIEAVNVLSEPGVNPIIALSNMGTSYFNAATDMMGSYFMMALLSVPMGIYGIKMMELLMLGLPLFSAMLGMMLSLAFLTAYYVPFVPYMLFIFGVIAWLMLVIEAMVAAPIMALGITHPEGDHALGKAEAGFMILLNIFLRPSMMIMGYILAIALCYVGVWILNSGFQHVGAFFNSDTQDPTNEPYTLAYQGFPGMFSIFFSVMVYSWIYWAIVEKSFALIHILPDSILRWIGTAPERAGGEAAGMGEKAKGEVEKSGAAAQGALHDTQASMGEKMGKYLNARKEGADGASGTKDSTPPKTPP